jgi:hypothetical protein
MASSEAIESSGSSNKNEAKPNGDFPVADNSPHPNKPILLKRALTALDLDFATIIIMAK